MTAKEFQSLLINAINDKVELNIYIYGYTYTCKGNSYTHHKDIIHMLEPSSFETMGIVNNTVNFFNLYA